MKNEQPNIFFSFIFCKVIQILILFPSCFKVKHVQFSPIDGNKKYKVLRFSRVFKKHYYLNTPVYRFLGTWWHKDGSMGKQERFSSREGFLPSGPTKPVSHPVFSIRWDQSQVETYHTSSEAAATSRLQPMEHFHRPPPREARSPGQRHNEGKRKQAAGVRHKVGPYASPVAWPACGHPQEGVVS